MDIGIEQVSIKPRSSWRKYLKRVFSIFLIFCFLIFLIVVRVQTKYSEQIVEPASLTPPNIGLVFGAGLRSGGYPSPILEKRILTAIKLFQDGRVGKFIMSGFKTDNHDEVEVMKNFAVNEGLPVGAMLFDDLGASTFDSCRNVRESFGLQKIVLISQKEHLRRALYLCNELGIEAVGVASPKEVSYWRDWGREMLASVYAWFKIIVY